MISAESINTDVCTAPQVTSESEMRLFMCESNVNVVTQDYRIQSTWKQRHAAMTPLFIETQSTLATQAVTDQSTLRDGGVSMSSATTAQLRMTVDVHNFTATQADGQTLCLKCLVFLTA